MVQRLKGTLKSQEDEPGIVAGRAFRRTLYGDYPYGFPEIGHRRGFEPEFTGTI